MLLVWRSFLTLSSCYLSSLDGPMTQPQLEFNLPPLQGERLNQHNFVDILELLVATGLVQKEDVDSPTTEPRYCVLSGATRPHPTTPAKILKEIQEVQDEWRASLQRQEKLKEALLDPTIQPRERLKNLLLEFPEVAYDPVYLAAMRNLNVDSGPVVEQKASGSRPRSNSRPKSSSKRKRKPSSGSQQKSPNTANTPSKGAAAATTASKGQSNGGAESKETVAMETKSATGSGKTVNKEAVQPSAG